MFVTVSAIGFHGRGHHARRRYGCRARAVARATVMGRSRLVAASPIAACVPSYLASRLGTVAAVGGAGVLLAVDPCRGCVYNA